MSALLNVFHSDKSSSRSSTGEDACIVPFVFYSSIFAIEICKNSDLFKAIIYAEISASSVGNLAGSKLEAVDNFLCESLIDILNEAVLTRDSNMFPVFLILADYDLADSRLRASTNMNECVNLIN